MYKSYINSKHGLVEVICDNNYLLSVTIVDKPSDGVENTISKNVAKQITEYFNYEREVFDVPLNLTDTFKDKIYKSLYESNYGATLSYKELANSIDSRAYQAVGSAMATNPYFIVVP